MSREPIIEMHSVSVTRGGTEILRELQWTMRAGEHWLILGPNGSGKSTMAGILTGYLWPTSGHITVLGREPGSVPILEIRRSIGLFEPALFDSSAVYHPDATALDVICTGWDSALAVYRDYDASVRARALSLFQNYFRSGSLRFPPERKFAALSSGERRKVLLLRMLLPEPEILLLDEPYESLDIPSRYSLERILHDFISRTGRPSITILHRVEEIPSFTTHALLLKDGSVLRQGRVDDLIGSGVLSELYDYPLHIGKVNGHYYCTPDIEP